MTLKKTTLLIAAFLSIQSLALLEPAYGEKEVFFTEKDPMPVREEKARNLVDAAIEYYKKNGRERAIAEFRNPDGDFSKQYPYARSGLILTRDGTAVVFSKRPCLEGKYVDDITSLDGKPLFKDIKAQLAKKPDDFAKVEYETPKNPLTGHATKSTMYGKQYDGFVFMNAAYHDEVVSEGPVKSDKDICAMGKDAPKK